MEKKELMCDCNIIHQNAVNIALKYKPKEKELRK